MTRNVRWCVSRFSARVADQIDQARGELTRDAEADFGTRPPLLKALQPLIAAAEGRVARMVAGVARGRQKCGIEEDLESVGLSFYASDKSVIEGGGDEDGCRHRQAVRGR